MKNSEVKGILFRCGILDREQHSRILNDALLFIFALKNSKNVLNGTKNVREQILFQIGQKRIQKLSKFFSITAKSWMVMFFVALWLYVYISFSRGYRSKVILYCFLYNQMFIPCKVLDHPNDDYSYQSLKFQNMLLVNRKFWMVSLKHRIKMSGFLEYQFSRFDRTFQPENCI